MSIYNDNNFNEEYDDDIATLFAGLNAKVTVDPERNRAKVIGESEYKVIAKAGGDICTAKMIKVNVSFLS